MTMKKPERVKQRVAKAVHIVSAFALGFLAHGVFHLLGPAWDYWSNWPISILVGLYSIAILFSKTPVPGSRAARSNMREYEAWCRVMGKQPSRKEYISDSWKNSETYIAAKRTIDTLTTNGYTDDEIMHLTDAQIQQATEANLKHLTDDDSQKFTIKMLKDMGCTKLAEDAERTINKLREIGAPSFTEDQIIRSILKEAGKQRR